MVTGRSSWLPMTLVLGVLFTANIGESNAEKQKRQLFREQVTPARGGKIPEDAFRADRLALNRLNKEGISVPDGVLLEARHVQKHPHSPSSMVEVVKVFQTPDGRYVPPEGRYHYDKPKTVDTTYLIRRPVDLLKNLGFNQRSTNQIHQVNQRYKSNRRPQIYETLPGNLIIPASLNSIHSEPFDSLFRTWNPDYSWDFLFPTFDDIFNNNVAALNSHQIIDDYGTFFNDFHNRRLRHVTGISGERDGRNSLRKITTRSHFEDDA